MTVDARLDRIERKLDEKVVYKDVYRSDLDRIEELIRSAVREIGAAATGVANTHGAEIANLKQRTTGLEQWRTAVYGMIAVAYFSIIGGVILFFVQRAGGG